MRFELSGTERCTFELSGRLAAGNEPIASGLPPCYVDDAIEVSVLFFDMRGLRLMRPLRLPPDNDYLEALWRVGVEYRGAPAWLAVACDIDKAMVRRLGKLFVRYPVREAKLAINVSRAAVERGPDSFELRLTELGGTPDAELPRPMLVRDGGTLYRIPWREDPAPKRHEVRLAVRDLGLSLATFGAEVRWDAYGLLHEGRRHHCGIAQRAQHEISSGRTA